MNIEISQILIVIFSSISIWCIASKNNYYHKWGFVAGLCGQPFWINAFIANEQWGMFVVSIWFTCNHIRGLKNNIKFKKRID